MEDPCLILMMDTTRTYLYTDNDWIFIMDMIAEAPAFNSLPRDSPRQQTHLKSFMWAGQPCHPATLEATPILMKASCYMAGMRGSLSSTLGFQGSG